MMLKSYTNNITNNMIHTGSLESLKRVKPTVIGSITSCNYSQYHRITVNDKKSSILIQSPITTITNKNGNWISFKISIEETLHKNFINALFVFFNKVYDKIQKRYQKLIQFDKPFIVGNTVTFYASMVNGCQIYDASGILSNDSPQKSSPAEFIFCLSQVQVSSTIDSPDELYGRILIEIVQVRLHDINAKALRELSFIDTNKADIPTKIEQEQVEGQVIEGYEKYFKMLKMGIPKAAVKQRMLTEGAEPDVLDGKTPSALKPIQTFDATHLRSKILKKTEKIVKKTQLKGGIGLGLSLDTIQSALTGLRKTRFLPFGS